MGQDPVNIKADNISNKSNLIVKAKPIVFEVISYGSLKIKNNFVFNFRKINFIKSPSSRE